MDEINIGLILIIGLIILIAFIVVNAIRIITEFDRLVIFRLGRYSGVRGPGLTFVVPLLERAIRVDLRERFLEIPSQTGITRDNAPIAIDFFVYYRIFDPKLSVIAIDNVVRATLNIATTTLRAVIGDIELDAVLAQRERINDTLRIKLDEVTARWGVKVTSVEIREIQPPREVQDAMNRQMSAERERRAMVTKASGEREAAIAVAEGEKQSAILKAQGERESNVLRAQGDRESQVLRAQGFAMALEAIYQQAKTLDNNTLLLQYLDTLREVGTSPSTKFILPMEITELMKNLGGTLSGGRGGS